MAPPIMVGFVSFFTDSNLLIIIFICALYQFQLAESGLEEME